MSEIKKRFTINKRLLWSTEFGITAIFIIIVLGLSISTPVFFTVTNIFNVLRQVSADGITSLGQLLVIVSGGIDLSVGSISAFTAVIMAKLLIAGVNSIVSLILVCIIGSMVGSFNGVLVSKGKVAPFIATLSSMTIFRGITYIITQGIPVYGITDNFFKFIGLGYVSIVPFPVIITLILFIIIGFMLKRMRVGRYIYAVGSNMEAARMSGVKIVNVQIVVYTISGLMATIGGLILASKLNAGVPQMGYGAELDSIAAVVIGGASLAGGKGFVYGTIIGALIIGMVRNGLNLLEVYPYWQSVVVGIVILIAVLTSQITIKKKNIS